MHLVFILNIIILNTVHVIRCEFESETLLDAIRALVMRRSRDVAEEQFQQLVGEPQRTVDVRPPSLELPIPIPPPPPLPGKKPDPLRAWRVPVPPSYVGDEGDVGDGPKVSRQRDQPGNALLQPEDNVPESAVNFPDRNKTQQPGHLVYGNKDNIALSWAPNEFVLYTGFRKGDADFYMNEIMRAAEKVDKEENNEQKTDVMMLLSERRDDDNDSEEEEKHDDDDGALEDDGEITGEIRRMSWAVSDGRRKGSNVIGPLFSSDSSSSDTDGSSSSEERNPYHPFTVHKDKYKQNWLWNLEMTGDHMNVNPHAPNMFSGPSSATLFFGRKWWYFHQDDYVPLR